MKTRLLSFRSVLAFVLVLTMVLTMNTAFVSAIEMNSYDYQARGLVLPDLISQAQAKEKGHIKRLISMEDEHSFVFENLDGTITSYTYDCEVQTLDKQGKLNEVDLDIKAKKDPQNQVSGYTVDGNGYQITFPVSYGSDQPIQIKSGEYQLSMAPAAELTKKVQVPAGQLKKVRDYDGTIAYKNAFGEDTILELSTTLSGIKEDIILKKAPSSNVIGYKISAPGLMGAVAENGSTEFRDPKTAAVIFRIPSPYAMDSFKGDRIEGDGHYTENIKVTLKETESGVFEYEMAVDSAFLNNPKTVYPVVIDPPVTISGADDLFDTYVASGTPDTQYYTNGHMYVGRDGTLDICRAYTKFDMAQLTSQDALSVSSAEYVNEEILGYTSDCNVRIYRVSETWTTPTIDYADQPTIDTSTIVDSLMVDHAGIYRFDVTSLVEGWLRSEKGATGGFASNGFTMRSDRESSVVLRKFRSAEATTNPPYLTITYTNVDRTAPNKPTGLTATYIKMDPIRICTVMR